MGTDAQDIKRKQMLYRANHRGIKEMDILLGGYAHAHLGGMTESEVLAFERFMAEQDRDLLSWFMGEHELPNHLDAELFEKIRGFAKSVIGEIE